MYSFDSRIRYSETDCTGKLHILSLINYFQDASTFQSEDLGLGVETLRKMDMVWVLSAWQIEIFRYPALGEEVTICTLPYQFRTFLGYRNFAMFTKDGERLAVANSLWTLISTKTYKPMMPPPVVFERFIPEERMPMDYGPRRIAVPAGGRMEAPITVIKEHLDTNHHVNNGRYIALAMHYLPDDVAVSHVRAEYKKQAFLGDVFYPYIAEEEGRYVVSLQDAEGKPYVVVELR